jgi:hypothetical protein
MAVDAPSAARSAGNSDVAAAIDAAFAEKVGAVPTQRLLRGGRWFDEAGVEHRYDDPEDIKIGQFIAGRSYRDLVGEPLLEWRLAAEALLHYSGEGLARLIPAYMMTVLLHPNARMSARLTEDVVSRLIRPGSSQSTGTHMFGSARTPEQAAVMLQAVDADFLGFASLLDAGQAHVIARFLRHIEPEFADDPCTENWPRIALESYWEGACDGAAKRAPSPSSSGSPTRKGGFER